MIEILLLMVLTATPAYASVAGVCTGLSAVEQTLNGIAFTCDRVPTQIRYSNGGDSETVAVTSYTAEAVVFTIGAELDAGVYDGVFIDTGLNKLCL